MRKLSIIAALLLASIGIYEYGSHVGAPTVAYPATIQQSDQQARDDQQASDDQQARDEQRATDDQEARDDQQASDDQQARDEQRATDDQEARDQKADGDRQLSNDSYYTNSDGNRVHSPAYSNGEVPPGATAQCADSSYSFSQHRQGTCSHHGGVSHWL